MILVGLESRQKHSKTGSEPWAPFLFTTALMYPTHDAAGVNATMLRVERQSPPCFDLLQAGFEASIVSEQVAEDIQARVNGTSRFYE